MYPSLLNVFFINLSQCRKPNSCFWKIFHLAIAKIDFTIKIHWILPWSSIWKKPWRMPNTMFLKEVDEYFAIKTATILTIPLKNCEVFQMRYCVLLWLKGLQTCKRSEEVRKRLPYTWARHFYFIKIFAWAIFFAPITLTCWLVAQWATRVYSILFKSP